MKYSVHNNRGTWYVSFYIPDRNGKLKQKYLSTSVKVDGIKGEKKYKSSEKKAIKAAAEIITKYEGMTAVNERMLLCDYVAEFVERRRSIIAPTTYYNDKHYLKKHIYPYFKNLRLCLKDVKPMHIEQYCRDKVDSGLSSNSVLKHIRLISPALKDAVKNGFIHNNPCDVADKPKKNKTKHTIYNGEELARLLKISKGTNIEVPIFLAVNFALRREEALGLRWSDIDFERKLMHIRNTATRGEVNGKLTTIFAERTKTQASSSDYILNDKVCKYLSDIKEKQKNMTRITDDYTDYVCVNEIGNILLPDYVTRNFAKLLKANGMKHITFHELRHSCLSWLVNKGIPMKVVQDYARHANYSTTADIYSHLDSTSKLNALDLITDMLDKNSNIE